MRQCTSVTDGHWHRSIGLSARCILCSFWSMAVNTIDKLQFYHLYLLFYYHLQYIIKNWLYFTYLPRIPPWTDFHQISHSCRSHGHNHLCQIFSDRLRDVDSVGVENEGFPLTKPMAVNTGLRNCAACDNSDRSGSRVSECSGCGHLTPATLPLSTGLLGSRSLVQAVSSWRRAIARQWRKKHLEISNRTAEEIWSDRQPSSPCCQSLAIFS